MLATWQQPNEKITEELKFKLKFCKKTYSNFINRQPDRPVDLVAESENDAFLFCL